MDSWGTWFDANAAWQRENQMKTMWASFAVWLSLLAYSANALEWRTWTSIYGISIVARAVDITTNNEVVQERSDGAIIKVKYSLLSQRDQEYVFATAVPRAASVMVPQAQSTRAGQTYSNQQMPSSTPPSARRNEMPWYTPVLSASVLLLVWNFIGGIKGFAIGLLCWIGVILAITAIF